jgi:c(7)-type cytochrome triheme protein
MKYTLRLLMLLCLCLPALAQQPIHDSSNPAAGHLQDLGEATAALPRDRHGAVDWAKALRTGAITPRASVDGSATQTVLALDVVLRNTKDMPFVRFPHQTHSEWLSCANCHDSLFVPKAGANAISMDKIFRGEYCGACHGRVAFITHLACERCHSVPQAGAKPWW